MVTFNFQVGGGMGVKRHFANVKSEMLVEMTNFHYLRGRGW